MFRGSELAIPADVLALVLYELHLKDLLTFMRLNKACRTVVLKDLIWQKNYTTYLPLNDVSNRVVQSWFELFKNHYRLPNKKFICDFLNLYPTCYNISGVGQVRLGKVETQVLACIDFNDWFKLIDMLRKEYRLNLPDEESQIVRSICLALVKYIIDTISKIPEWNAKTNMVIGEIEAITAIERLDAEPNRHDEIARFTKRTLLLQQLDILKMQSRDKVQGFEDIFRQHFQTILGIDFDEFKRKSQNGNLQWAILRNRFRAG